MSTVTIEALRELLRTPVVREILDAGEPLQGEAGRDLARALLADDPALGLGLLARSPQLVNALCAALAEAGSTLERLPAPLQLRLLQQLAAQLDRPALLATARLYGRLLARLLALPELVHAIDPGSIRQAATGLAAAAAEALAPLCENAARDPLLLANLAGIVAPVLNALLDVVVRALRALDLPPELLASALLAALEDIDAARAGALLEQTALLLARAHEGDLLLGRGEPRLRLVLGRFLGQALAAADPGALARAVQCLAEDARTGLRAIADVVRGDRERVAPLLAAVEPALRTIGEGAAELASALLPPDPGRPARLADAALGWLGEALRRDPALAQVIARHLILGVRSLLTSRLRAAAARVSGWRP